MTAGATGIDIFGTIGLIMVNMVKMVELLDHSLKGVIIALLWSANEGDDLKNI